MPSNPVFISIPAAFENPCKAAQTPVFKLEIRCSIQLSYGRLLPLGQTIAMQAGPGQVI
jgi:hypothetical protein